MPLIVSKATRKLVVPRTNATVAMFPEAHNLTHLNEDHLVIPHGLREYLMLNHLGFKVPNPIGYYYNWPGGRPPFAVQKSTCAMLTANPRSYVLNGMGTGKTKTALWAWDYLRGNGYAGKLLVVAPLSTLNFVWGREVFATLPHRKVSILYGSKKRRLEKLADPEAEIFIINHDGLRIIHKELEARTDIDVLCLDELAVYRNNSDRSKLMRRFAVRFNWVWGLTGAPMPNEPTDVWSQCKIITPNTVPKFFNQAREMLMIKQDQFRYIAKKDAVDNAFKMMQPSVRYSLEDVLELPDTVSRTLDVDLSEDQKKAYSKMATVFKTMIKDKVITAVNAGSAMNKLLQVSTGWVYTTNPDFVEIDAAPRISLLLDLIEASEHKVLVFVPYRHALAGLSKVFTGNDPSNPKVDHVVVHGDTADRDQIFNLFQNTAKYKVLLAHPQCLAHGLTLTAADTIIWYSPTASLEIYEQANARIRRVGQKHKQQILHLQSTPVEKKLYRLLRAKQKTQDQLLAMLEEATGEANE